MTISVIFESKPDLLSRTRNGSVAYPHTADLKRLQEVYAKGFGV